MTCIVCIVLNVVPSSGEETRDDKNFFLIFKDIISWDNVFSKFVTAVESGQTPLKIYYPGVEIKPIICPVKTHCPNLNISFQPPAAQRIGGICGLDFMPRIVDGIKTRIFLLPQLPAKNETKHNHDGPRGIVATTTGEKEIL